MRDYRRGCPQTGRISEKFMSIKAFAGQRDETIAAADGARVGADSFDQLIRIALNHPSFTKFSKFG